MTTDIEKFFHQNNFKITDQRRVILKVALDAIDHPSAEDIYKRVQELDKSISLATVYRTIALLEEHGFLDKLDFNEGKARYESTNNRPHHHHLIDINDGNIIEFEDEEFEQLKDKIAQKLGYKVIIDKLELYCVKLNDNSD